MWDAADGRPLFRWQSARDQPRRVALDATGRRVVISAVHDGVGPWRDGAGAIPFLAVFDVDTGREVFRNDTFSEQCWAMDFSPDGGRLAAAGLNRRVWVWDLERSRLLVDSAQGQEDPLDLAFSPDGRRLAIASRSQVELMDPETGDEVLVLRGASQQVPNTNGFNPRVRFSPDGSRILAICSDTDIGVSEWSIDAAGSGDRSARIRMARRRSVGYHLFAAGDHLWHLTSFVARFHAERVNQLEIETAPELLLRGLVNLQVGQLDHAEADFARRPR